MSQGPTTLRMATAALALGATIGFAPQAKAVDLDEHTKYLAFIEGFQYFFEYCQAEATLPEAQVSFARAHIGERRALIFAGLHEIQRNKIMADMPAKKALMIKGVMENLKKEQANAPLNDLCKRGFFEGVVDSEQKSKAKEVAAITKAKN
jgi:hypothetical protein